MLYCRGCGKEIHETAALCPHCGFQYTDKTENSRIWMLVISAASSLILALNWLNLPWDGDRDLITGVILFSIISIIMSSISLSKTERWKALHISCIVVSSISLLIAFGSS